MELIARVLVWGGGPADLSAFEISGAEVMREVPRFAQDSRDVGDVLITKGGRGRR